MTVQRLAVRLYALTLWCFPAEHRHEWAEVMIATFEDMVRDTYDQGGLTGLIAMWLTAFFDTLKVATVEHFTSEHKGYSIMDNLTEINNYRVQHLIGEDGVANVYCVQDSDGNPAALKLFKDAENLRFYEQLKNNLGQIQHPVAPRLLDSGTYRNQKYCVMELIEGEHWLKKLESSKTPINEQQAIEWAIEICDFLHYIHESQIPLIHRSLKPSNIVVQNDGHVRLLDYEIMERYAPDMTYPLIGTEGYSPPEQYVGHSDARSDVYALGASLYHLLTKRDPRKDAPFLFHFYTPRSLNPDISKSLEMVILRAVEHKPEDRFPSASAMRTALENCLSD